MIEFQHTEQIEIDAAPEAVYDLLTDIARTGEWSPVCTGCEWRNADGPEVGAWFVGHNEADGQVWDTESQVVAATRPREFAWLVGGRYARWGWRIDPLDGGRTRLVEDWEFLPAGREMFRTKYGEAADERIGLRRRQALSGMPATLAAVKRIAEAR